MVRHLLILALIAVGTLQPGLAVAEQLPTEVDLRAAYCVPILEDELAVSTDFLRKLENFVASQPPHPTPREAALAQAVQDKLPAVKQVIAQRESAIRRMQAYLVPRLRYLDPTGLLLATESAETDIQDAKRRILQCGAQCQGPSELENCEKCLTDPDFQKRRETCRSPSWLPF